MDGEGAGVESGMLVRPGEQGPAILAQVPRFGDLPGDDRLTIPSAESFFHLAAASLHGLSDSFAS